MATYKVLQDIEAEDKLVGPLSLRQFIYFCAAALCLYLSVIFVTKHVPFLLVLTLPPAVFCGFFAFPWSHEQPTEVWALARIRFMLKPRRRIWNQSGVKELVTVTAPKKIEKIYTNGLSQAEVHSRLNALASTIDSRGWAIKNVNVNLNSQSPVLPAIVSSDRLVDVNTMPQSVPDIDVTASDDIFDTANSPVAQQFDVMMAKSAQDHRQRIVTQLEQDTPAPLSNSQATTPAADYWFLNQPTPTGATATPADTSYVKPQVVFPGANAQTPAAIPPADPTPDEQALLQQLQQQSSRQQVTYSHLKNIQPLGSQPAPIAQPPARTMPAATQTNDQPAVTPAPDPAKIELSRNNDLDISTIAHLANEKEPPSDEVVISLH
jgi:hypothetical protein